MPLRSFVLSAVKHNGDCVKVIGLNKPCHMGERGKGSSKPAGNLATSKGLGCLFLFPQITVPRPFILLMRTLGLMGMIC